MIDSILKKREEACFLYDLYGPLLTNSQRSIFADYYFYDLSLAEIAENRHISRAAASDALRKAFRKMEDDEKKLGFGKKRREIKKLVSAYEAASSSQEKKQALQKLEEYLKNAI